jgi:hypothetical protein
MQADPTEHLVDVCGPLSHGQQPDVLRQRPNRPLAVLEQLQALQDAVEVVCGERQERRQEHAPSVLVGHHRIGPF